MDILTLRQRIEPEEFDYQMLLDGLREYSRPRDKISDLLKKGVIVRVKKGLYVFAPQYRRRPVSREVLANLLYGPSYISLDYALQFHGLIPERVEEVTSVTTGRSRSFPTPLGVFSYRRIPVQAFAMGMDRVALDDGRAFLIATPEKALADRITTDRDAGLRTRAAVETYLLESLRVDPATLETLDADRLAEIADRLHSKKIRLLSAVIARMNRQVKGRG